MRAPRGVILVAVMLALGVLTLAAVPLMAGESTLPRGAASADDGAAVAAALAHCQQRARRQARAGTLATGSLDGGVCAIVKQVDGAGATLWHVRSTASSSGAVELWVSTGTPRRVHARPVPR